MILWEETEVKFPQFKTIEERQDLKRSIKYITITIMGSALCKFTNYFVTDKRIH